ncbi:hypothetical protein GCM10017667_64130 [Streptomyces filamentosus]|uniref:Uncharacterized protein n=1 Tax=Streptomyces filamentosus TaxID=67294 RepID=A0A919BVE1_STRFL|nr:hypothetical protein GCM10017667_64130 [Streptomyces filamentosus]
MTSEQNPRTPRVTETLPPPEPPRSPEDPAPRNPPRSALSTLTTSLTPPPATPQPSKPPAPRRETAPAPLPKTPAPARPAPPASKPQAAPAPPRPQGTPEATAPAPPTSPPPAAPAPQRPPGAPAAQTPAAPPRPRTAPPASPAAQAPAAPAPAVPARPQPTSAPLPAPAPPRPRTALPRGWAADAGPGRKKPSGPSGPAVETTARLRPVRVPAYGTAEETPVETTTRLRPIRERRRGRALAVGACLVLGTGLVGGALAGMWLAASGGGRPAEPAGYTVAKELWHNAPVDTLLPRTLTAPEAGPGPSARTWTRVVVAPDAPCTTASLAPRLLAAVDPLGCERVLRATYTDATATSVLTVGLVFTRADVTAQRALGGRALAARLGQDVPPALAGPGTVAAGFGPAQRTGWWATASTDLPVVVTAVSGFADGRAADRAVPADQAMKKGRADAVAQSGLGHEALGIAERLEKQLRTTARTAAKEQEAR